MSDLNPPPTPWHQQPAKQQQQAPQWGPQPPWPQQPPKKRRNGRTIALVIGGVFVVLIGLGIVGAALGGSKKPAAASSGGGNPAASSQTTSTPPPPAPAASPDGTYQGACDYTLGDDPAGSPGTAVATGDIQVTNTGNIGTVDRLRITWPQQGYSPLVMHKTIRLAAGASEDVQFHRHLTSTELDNLQNWQTGHNYNDGCTYNTAMISEFGSVQP
jgi:hypothetical protein